MDKEGKEITVKRQRSKPFGPSQTSIKSVTSIGKKKRKKQEEEVEKQKKEEPKFDLPGVRRMFLSKLTQRIIGCVVDEHVNPEEPWIYIDKELLADNIKLHDHSSEFLPIRNEILQFSKPKMLLGYIPKQVKEDETALEEGEVEIQDEEEGEGEIDIPSEFYVCLTESATYEIEEKLRKVKEEQEQRMYNTVYKQIKPWESLGSETEINEGIMKRNRPLLEVEIESKYPVLPKNVIFTAVRAEKIRSGYMELHSGDEYISNVYKKRVDASVQVSPAVTANEAQTICTYPSNSATQYEYLLDDDKIKAPEEELKKCIEGYESNLSNILTVNVHINLYSNDYEVLLKDPLYHTKIPQLKADEYMSFVDLNLCKDKMVSAACWHPLWSGIIALAYMPICPIAYITKRPMDDVVHQLIYDKNIVLIWSFTDDIKPKLILEAHRPVQTIAFCPFDENILIGGCVNGQIIIWDIKNRLNKVEEKEIFTNAQQKYRASMLNLMTWMKNIHDIAVVRPTVISDLKYSHKAPVNTLKWISPFHEVSKTGKIIEIQEDNEHSLQFLTCSEDGSVLIWDLLKKPELTAGGFKPRKLGRLKKRPSALTVDVSPLRMLHLILKPVYQINVPKINDRSKVLPISRFFFKYTKINYVELSSPQISKSDLMIRRFYKPMLVKPKKKTETEFYVSSMEGDFIRAKWDGQEFDSGEAINFETAEILTYGKYHDGPITNITVSSSTKCILTVGGKIFAVWRDDFSSKPIFWRKCKAIITHGSFYYFKQSRIKLVLMDGSFEEWIIYYKSNACTISYIISRGIVTSLLAHPRKLHKNVFGFCDNLSTCRLFYIDFQKPALTEKENTCLINFINVEIQRKKNFLAWQDEWNKRNATPISTTKVETVAEAEETQKQTKKETKKSKENDEETTTKAPPAKNYLDVIKEQHEMAQQKRIRDVMLKKKQLDTDQLFKLRKPLEKLDEENEIKKKRQKINFKNAENIFNRAVASTFPDVVKKQPPKPINPYMMEYTDDSKYACFQQFLNLSTVSADYVDENPYERDFNWKHTLAAGRKRRKLLDKTTPTHAGRYSKIKKERDENIIDTRAPKVKIHEGEDEETSRE